MGEVLWISLCVGLTGPIVGAAAVWYNSRLTARVNSASSQVQSIANLIKGLQDEVTQSHEEIRKLRADYWIVWDRAEVNGKLYQEQRRVSEDCERSLATAMAIAAATAARMTLENGELSRRIALFESALAGKQDKDG